MPTQDYFVGFAAAAVGAFFLLGAVLNAAWLMELRRARMLSESLGKTGARVALGLAGIVLIALGGVIASGWRVDWSWFSRSDRTPSGKATFSAIVIDALAAPRYTMTFARAGRSAGSAFC